MNIDFERFESARIAVSGTHGRFNIGTYKERSQHLILKLYCEPDTSCHEVSVCGYIADIKNGQGITEIQTCGFSRLREKLSAFLIDYNVRIVYPCPTKKRICWVEPESGAMTCGVYRTYSKNLYSLLPELLHIWEFFSYPGFSVEIFETAVSEIKLLDGYGADRKKRSTKEDTVPDVISDIITLSDLSDISAILPFSDGQLLTNEEMAKAFGLRRKRLWMAEKFLVLTGILTEEEKIGNKKIYKYHKRNVTL